MKYMFPHSTCETPITYEDNKTPLQPWSFYVNIVNTLLLCIATIVSIFYKKYFVTLALFSFTMFEAWHSFSHYTHIENNPHIHIFIVHILGYCMTISLYLAISQLSSNYQILPLPFFILLASIVLDIYIYIYVQGYWTVFGGLLVLSIMTMTNLYKIPPHLRYYMFYLCIGIIILFALFVNEAYNCEKMKNIFGDLPFHAFIEILGMILFIILIVFLFQWTHSVSIKL